MRFVYVLPNIFQTLKYYVASRLYVTWTSKTFKGFFGCLILSKI
jgi:hypothetical protein